MSKRNFLVIVDETKEMEVALNYACIRAKKTDGNIILASFVKPIDVLTTKNVGDIMKNEAREEAEVMIQKASAYVKEETGITPILLIRESEIIEGLLKLIEEENISVLVVAAATDQKEGPGPIIASILTTNYTRLKIPIMIVPGNFSKEHINHIG